MDIYGFPSAVIFFISVPAFVLGAVNVQISGNTEVAEAFKLVCSSPLNTIGQTAYTFFRSPTPGGVGTSVGTIGYFPNNLPQCHDRGINPIPYPFGCEDNGISGYITINVTTGTDLTEHDKYWRCVTLVDTVAAENNEVHVIIYDPVKTVQIVSEDGATLTSPVVISESNTNTKLLCTTGTSGSRPEAQLTWWRVGIPNQQIISGVTALPGQQLTWEHVTARSTLNVANRALDGVSVFCKAGINGGDTQSDKVLLSVTFGPINVFPSQTHVNITEGQSDSSVSCTATCNPTCTYRWLKDGSPVNTGSMLQLMSVSKSQAGNYYCEASNTFINLPANTRVSTVAVIVNVKFSPEVQLKPESNIQPTPDPYSILLGQNNVGLRCGVVDSNPPPSSYTWSENNSVIEGAVQETYTIVMVTHQTAGTYRCRGNNGIGDPAFGSLDLAVQYGPVIDPIINQIKEEGTSLYVACRYTSNPPTNQVRWTKVSNNTFSQNQNSLTISPLHRSDSGMYRCSVTNTLNLSGKPNEQRTAWMDVYLDVQSKVAKPESIVGPVIGGAIGGVVVGALGMLAAIYLWRRYRKRRTKSQATTNRTEERGNESTYQDLTQNRSASTLEYQTLNLSEQPTAVYLNLELNMASINRNVPHNQNLTSN